MGLYVCSFFYSNFVSFEWNEIFFFNYIIDHSKFYIKSYIKIIVILLLKFDITYIIHKSIHTVKFKKYDSFKKLFISLKLTNSNVVEFDYLMKAIT